MKRKQATFYASAVLAAVVLAGCATSTPAPQAGAQVEIQPSPKETKIKDADLSKIPAPINAPKTTEQDTSIEAPQSEPELTEIAPPEVEPTLPSEPEAPEENQEAPPIPEGNTITEEEAAALDAAADALLPPEEKPWVANPEEVPLLPDGTVAPKPGDVEIITPAPPNTSPDPEPNPEVTPPVEEPTHAKEIYLNNIELADACLGVSNDILNNALNITDSVSESKVNGQCRISTPNVDNDTDSTGASITINYLPASSTFINDYKKGAKINGVGQEAYLSALGEDSTLILAIQGDYATLITTSSIKMDAAQREALTALASTEALTWINEVKPPAVSYWETHGSTPPKDEGVKDTFTPGPISPIPEDGMVLPGANDTPEVRDQKQAIATVFDTAKMKVKALIFDLF